MTLGKIGHFLIRSSFDRTLIDTTAKFTCNFGLKGLASKLEGMGARRFKEHMQKSKDALNYVIERLRSQGHAH
jgi:hypothetical protein